MCEVFYELRLNSSQFLLARIFPSTPSVTHMRYASIDTMHTRSPPFPYQTSGMPQHASTPGWQTRPDQRVPQLYKLYIYASEGCPHGTHTGGTANTRGTYSRVHTQTHTNTYKHTFHVMPRARALCHTPQPRVIYGYKADSVGTLRRVASIFSTW